jgi:hypothetical protein
MDEIVNAFKEAYGKKPDEVVPDKPIETVEQTTEAATEISKPAETAKPAETVETQDFGEFNQKYGKKYGREIKEEKELQELFSYPTKYTELEGKHKEMEQAYATTKKQLDDLTSEYESKKENLKFIDLKKYFANEDLYIANQISLKYPDKDINAITDIVKTDLSKANPVDLLIKRARLNDGDIYSGMDDSQVKEVIASDFNGVDLNDPSTWDNVTKAKIAKASKEARLELEALQKVELPVPIDIEKEKDAIFSKEKTKFEQIKSQWVPIVDKMLSNFTELVIPDETGKELYKYTPELNDAFKAEVSTFVDYLAYTGQPVSEKTIVDVLEGIKGRYIARELPKIMKAHAQSVSTKVNDEWHAKVHNDAPISEKTKPVDKSNEIWSKMESMI